MEPWSQHSPVSGISGRGGAAHSHLLPHHLPVVLPTPEAVGLHLLETAGMSPNFSDTSLANTHSTLRGYHAPSCVLHCESSFFNLQN